MTIHVAKRVQTLQYLEVTLVVLVLGACGRRSYCIVRFHRLGTGMVGLGLLSYIRRCSPIIRRRERLGVSTSSPSGICLL